MMGLCGQRYASICRVLDSALKIKVVRRQHRRSRRLNDSSLSPVLQDFLLGFVGMPVGGASGFV
jgi:hypothetical protein